jgi:hypothetical protein
VFLRPGPTSRLKPARRNVVKSDWSSAQAEFARGLSGYLPLTEGSNPAYVRDNHTGVVLTAAGTGGSWEYGRNGVALRNNEGAGDTRDWAWNNADLTGWKGATEITVLAAWERMGLGDLSFGILTGFSGSGTIATSADRYLAMRLDGSSQYFMSLWSTTTGRIDNFADTVPPATGRFLWALRWRAGEAFEFRAYDLNIGNRIYTTTGTSANVGALDNSRAGSHQSLYLGTNDRQGANTYPDARYETVQIYHRKLEWSQIELLVRDPYLLARMGRKKKTQLPPLDVRYGVGEVFGNVAHDAADSGNPLKLGVRAFAHGAAPTAVAADERTDWLANRHGIPFVMGGHPKVERLTQKNTAAQTDQVLKTVAAGEKFVVTQISAFCDRANTVDVQVLIEFDDTSDVRVFENPGIAAGMGAVEGDGSGILAIGGDGQDLLLTNEVPTTGSVTVHVSGYIVPS